ncbi:MAG TPA: hypothetical protein VFS96_04955, partial [Nitrolancea sp.]|nr:hypothetical protein [Nitrolancea sp.]
YIMPRSNGSSTPVLIGLLEQVARGWIASYPSPSLTLVVISPYNQAPNCWPGGRPGNVNGVRRGQ